MVPLETPPQSPDAAAKAALSLRIIWGAMLAGQVIFLAVVIVLQRHGLRVPEGAELIDPLFYINLVVLAVSLPAGVLVRGALLRQGTGPDGAVSVPAYAGGTVVLLSAKGRPCCRRW